MNGLVPVVGALCIGGDLGGCAEVESRGSAACGTPFGSGHSIITIEVNERGIDILSAAVDHHRIFWQSQAGSGANDQSVADQEGGVGMVVCPSLTIVAWVKA